jgi:DNA polymerase-3 subunit alpha
MGYAGYFLIVARLRLASPREQGIATTCRGSRAGLDRDLHAGHHAGRPDPLRAAVRALPQPRPRDHAGHRRRLRGRRRDEVIATSRASTARTTSPRSSPSARCSPGRPSATSGGSWASATARSTAIAKAGPNQLGIKLDEALEIAPPLREHVPIRAVVQEADRPRRQLEGVARNASTHAAGVVISREPLTDLMPLQRATNSDG